MSKVESITQRFESLFKKCNSLDAHEYESVLFNVELLKKKYFNSKHKRKSHEMFERMSFTEFVNLHTI